MPRAARAVGAAISSNPLLIFIPDHRVVNSSGLDGAASPGSGIASHLRNLEKSFAD